MGRYILRGRERVLVDDSPPQIQSEYSSSSVDWDSNISNYDKISKVCCILLPILTFVIGQLIQYVVFAETGKVLVFDLIFSKISIGALIASSILGMICIVHIIIRSWKLVDDYDIVEAWVYIVIGGLCFAVLPCISGYIGIILTSLISYWIENVEEELIPFAIVAIAFILGQVLLWVNYSRNGQILVLTNLILNSENMKLNPLIFSIFMSILLALAAAMIATAACREVGYAIVILLPLIIFSIVIPTITAIPLFIYALIVFIVEEKSGEDKPCLIITIISYVLITIMAIVLGVKAQIPVFKVVLNCQGGVTETEEIIVPYRHSMPNADSPKKTGYTFLDYWDESTGGVQYYDALMQSVHNWNKKEDGVLYAHWSANKYTITFDKQGGYGGSNFVEVEYNAAMPNATAPTKHGYMFYGYYTSENGKGTKYYDSNMKSVRSWDKTENVILFANWNSTLSLNLSPGSLPNLSGTVTVTLTTFGGSGNYSYTLDNNNHSGISCSLREKFLYVTKNDNNASGIITVYVNDNVYGTSASRSISYSTSGCVATGTAVTLADGTTKKIEDVQQGDMILSWNFITGKVEAMPVSLYWYHGDDLYHVINLHFSDGVNVRVINTHGFFDYTCNKFVYISNDNYNQYIGHNFAFLGLNNMLKKVTLLSVDITEEVVGSYSLRTACNDNAILSGLISLTWEDYIGMLTYFEIGNDMKYDEYKMQHDINEYGLYTYDEWADYISYDEFVTLNGQYFKILIGKGILSLSDIYFLIEGLRSL